MRWVRSVLLVPPGTPNIGSAGGFLRWLARRQLPNLVVGGVYGTIWMGTQGAIPLVVGAAVEAVIHGNTGQIVGWAFAVLGLGVVQAGSGGLRHREAVTNRMLAAACVQRLVARQASALGGDLPRHVAAGEVAGIGASDVGNIANVLDVLPRLTGSVVAVVGVAVVLLLTSLPLGLVVVAGVPLTALAMGPLLGPLERRQRAQREEIGKASSITSDTVVGLRVLRGLGGEKVFSARFARASQRIRVVAVRTAKLEATLAALQLFLPGVLLVAITGIGAHLVLTGQLTPGTLVTAYGEAAFLLIPLEALVEAAYYFTAGLVAAGRVVALLSRERDLSFAPLPPAGRTPGGALYDEQTRLKFEPGLLTAVVTDDQEETHQLVERLGRYSEPPEGLAVTVGGLSLSELSLSELRTRIMFLPKEATLLAGTLAETLSPPAAGALHLPLADALRGAGAQEILDGLPEGALTEVPERGTTLSGGQRQRLLLAAALRANPEVLVLDEPTSAVDAHTEAEIAFGLREVRQGGTTVVFTTSPLLCESADVVVLWSKGVATAGSHHELLRSNARYRELVARGMDSPGAPVAKP